MALLYGNLGALSSLRGLIWRGLGGLGAFARLPASGGVGSVLDEGSSRLEQIESLRRCARWRPDGQAQMGEDAHNHRRFFDGGDDLQAGATIGAVFDIDIENALE